MFDQTALQVSTNLRNGPSQWLSEAVATFGLLTAILATLRWRPDAMPYAVGLYITTGYWFTASTFANPAVTIARSFTDSFSGIAPQHMPTFIAAQLVGGVLAAPVFGRLLAPSARKTTSPRAETTTEEETSVT